MELKYLNATLSKYVENVIQRYETISEGRREVLRQVASEIRNEIAGQGAARLTFVCTHNSRRSHLAQVWAAVAAVRLGVKNIESYSGGTEVTACNERTVAAFKRAGFEVGVDGDGESENPMYELRFDSSSEPIRCFSKIYNETPNPTESYFAMMCCGDVDERCPVVGGAKHRFSIHYVDPKVSDSTEAESETYDERCLQIATEMFFLIAAISE